MVESIEVLDVIIQHACLSRGVKFVIELSQPFDYHSIKDHMVQDYYAVVQNGNGFFRFGLCNRATVSGVIGSEKITLAFSMFSKESVLGILEDIFPGFLEIYKNASIDEQK